MDSGLAPEFIYDQGIYYPSAGNYYGYVGTGMEPTIEWDDHQKVLGMDGQDLQFSGLQPENLPCVYYTPGYDYPQSPYNPFNPYIPGAGAGTGTGTGTVMGTDNPYVGTQQCLTSSPYLQTVPPPGYIPFVSQPGPDSLLNGYADPFYFSGGGLKYATPQPSSGLPTAPLKVSFENLSLEPSRSSSHQIQASGRLSEATGINAEPTKKFSPYGMTSTGVPQIVQGTEHLTLGGAPSVRSQVKVSLPAYNGFTNSAPNIRGWTPPDRMKPRIQYSGVPNRSLGEQNMGPRINKPRTQLKSPNSLRSYSTKSSGGNLDANFLCTDQYNREDFPVDYTDAKFFVIKSYSEDDVHKSIKYNVWSSTSIGNKKLDLAYEEAQRLSLGKPRKCPIFLFFSVNASGHFCGIAEMIGPVDFHKDMDFWLQDKWTGSFPVKWHIIKDVPNSSFRHIILANNEYRPVTSSRDTQEVPYLPGISMLTIFKNCMLNTSILDDFMYYEDRQRIMQEEKSMLAGSKSYETSISPSMFIPSTKPSGSVSQPPKSDEHLLNSVAVQPTFSNGKERNITVNHSVESDRRKIIHPTVDQDRRADEKQKHVESSSFLSHEGQPNGSVNQPSKSDALLSSVNPPIGTAVKPLNHRAREFSVTKTEQTKKPDTLKDPERLGSNGVHATSRHVANNSKDRTSDGTAPAGGSERQKMSNTTVPAGYGGRKSDGIYDGSVHAENPEITNYATGISKIGETDVLTVGCETDVLTVGSVQIEITNGFPMSGTLTIGSSPMDTKAAKS